MGGTGMERGGEKEKELRIKEEEEGEVCPYCGHKARFFWRCPCGFRMCQKCMNENLWGMTCNYVTWTCPDCGQDRSF